MSTTVNLTQASENLIDLNNQSKFTITATHSDYNQPLRYLHDNNIFTDWSNYFSSYSYLDTIFIDFETPVEVTRFDIDAVKNKTIRLEYFDGSDWQLAGEFETENYREQYSIVSTIAQRWRLRNIKNKSDKDPDTISIDEIALIGDYLPNEPQNNLKDGDIIVELAQAPVDECHFSPGSPDNIYPKPANTACPEGSQEKRNEAYVWSLTKYQDENTDRLYFGTGANVFCIGLQVYLGLSNLSLEIPGSFACQNGRNTDKPVGDQRPASIYNYDVNAESLSNVSIDPKTQSLLDISLGLRSGGQHKGIVFLSGPNFNNAITVVAINAATGEIIDSTSLDYGFTSARKTRVINDELYFAVGAAESTNPSIKREDFRRKGGAILHWLGDAEAILAGDTSTLFDFEIVATNLDAEAAEINEFEGKAIASTWPTTDSELGGGLWQKTFPLTTDPTGSIGVWDAGQNYAYTLEFTPEGNLELYDVFGLLLFESDTANQGADKLVLQDNAVLAIYTADNEILWTSTDFAPFSAEANNISLESNVQFPLGFSMNNGDSVVSNNQHVSLTLANGNLKLAEKEIAWTRVWGAEDYDPDPFIASTYGISATVSKDDWLYWGSLHVPGASIAKFAITYGELLAATYAAILVPSFHRGTVLLRGKNLGQANEEIELLYGGYNFVNGLPAGYYPVHQFDTFLGLPVNTGIFRAEMNKLGQVPKFGREGFGNTLNQYLWNIVEYNDDIYIGTFDQDGLTGEFSLGAPLTPNFISIAGADLYKLDTEEMAVQPVFLDGGTTPLSYGIRNSIVVGDDLYLGTAGNSSLNPDGGWRLLKVTAEELAD